MSYKRDNYYCGTDKFSNYKNSKSGCIRFSNKHVLINTAEQNDVNEEEENLVTIKDKIKSCELYKISDDWVVRYQKDGFSKKILIDLNPYEDCSEKNPLYRHKEWLNYLYTNLELSDPTIGKICNLSASTISKWRNILKINTKEFEYRR